MKNRVLNQNAYVTLTSSESEASTEDRRPFCEDCGDSGFVGIDGLKPCASCNEEKCQRIGIEKRPKTKNGL